MQFEEQNAAVRQMKELLRDQAKFRAKLDRVVRKIETSSERTAKLAERNKTRKTNGNGDGHAKNGDGVAKHNGNGHAKNNGNGKAKKSPEGESSIPQAESEKIHGDKLKLDAAEDVAHEEPVGAHSGHAISEPAAW